MEYKFCCFGTYQNIFRCLIKCPFKKECENETERIKILKNIDKGVDKNGKKEQK